MKNCISFRVKGRVQGVFFRKSTLNKAKELGIVGWVRNCSNGDVEGLACGDEANLGVFEKWLWMGSPASKVEEVHHTHVPNEPFDKFEIIR